jgi:hypothetical protein
MTTSEKSGAVSGGVAGLVTGLVAGAALCIILWGVKSFDHPGHYHEYWTAANEGFWIGIGLVAGIAVVNAVSGVLDSIKSRMEG